MHVSKHKWTLVLTCRVGGHEVDVHDVIRVLLRPVIILSRYVADKIVEAARGWEKPGGVVPQMPLAKHVRRVTFSRRYILDASNTLLTDQSRIITSCTPINGIDNYLRTAARSPTSSRLSLSHTMS
jgi:hypothetical protein